MNQKEEIGKLERELEGKKGELKQLKVKLEEKYGSTIQAISITEKKKSKL